MAKDTILVTGANGQIGTVLTESLRTHFGTDNVIASDIRQPEISTGPFELLDILDKANLNRIIRKYRIGTVYHLAAILSAKAEGNPQQAWNINMEGLFNVLEAARTYRLKLFFPSSIAVFGGSTPLDQTPQYTSMEPTTVYGISKVAGENWGNYYHQKYGVDVRSVRYPGIIGYQSLPGGGTTDYAVEIYHYAVKEEQYSCFLKADARLPMMYMPDAIRATLELMQAPSEQIRVRTSYNIGAMSFTPKEIAKSIQRFYPGFKAQYNPDFRQEIAASWSSSIDDSQARTDWGWKPAFDLDAMTEDMILNLRQQYSVMTLNGLRPTG